MLSDLFAAIGWLRENWWLVAAGAVGIVTFQFWFTPAVKFFTETKAGAAIGAAAVLLGGAWLYRKKDRETHIAIGRAQVEREMRIKMTPKATKAAPKADWWLTKKERR